MPALTIPFPFLFSEPALTIHFPANKFPNKIALKVPNNILKNFHFSFLLFIISLNPLSFMLKKTKGYFIREKREINHTHNFLFPEPALTILFPVNKFPNKLALKVPNNILENPPFFLLFHF